MREPANDSKPAKNQAAAELGQHHHISGRYLGFYAREMAWREDTRRFPNGSLHAAATGAVLMHPVSRVWAGYWQRGSH